MSYLPDFEHDVLVCFVDEDNRPLSGNGESGWVDGLATFLTKFLEPLGMGAARVTTNFEGNLPREEHVRALTRAAITIVVLSPAFLESAWVREQRTRDLLAGVATRFPQRTFLVLKSEVDEPSVPKELWRLKHRLFWRTESGSPFTLGLVNANEDDRYLSLVNDLAHALATQLRNLKAGSASTTRPSSELTRPVAFLAEVTPDLEDARAAVERFLEQHQVDIRPRGHLPSGERELDAALAADLQESTVFIELLGGNVAQSQPGSRFHQQRTSALGRRGLRVLQWREPALKLTSIESKELKDLLELPTVRAESISDFQHAILDALETAAPPQSGSGPIVFIDARPEDDEHLQRIFGQLRDKARWDWHEAQKLTKIKMMCDVADGVLVFWGTGQSHRTQERYYQFLKYWRAKRKLESRLRIFDGPPPDKPAFQGAGLPVIEGRDGSRAQLMEFLKALMPDVQDMER
jgi:hypothetical protein